MNDHLPVLQEYIESFSFELFIIVYPWNFLFSLKSGPSSKHFLTLASYLNKMALQKIQCFLFVLNQPQIC